MYIFFIFAGLLQMKATIRQCALIKKMTRRKARAQNNEHESILIVKLKNSSLINIWRSLLYTLGNVSFQNSSTVQHGNRNTF